MFEILYIKQIICIKKACFYTDFLGANQRINIQNQVIQLQIY